MNTNNYTYKSYCTGFILSIILTTIPFYLIKNHSFNKKTLLLIIISCAIIQIYVHLIFFLHLNVNDKSHKKWNIIALIFTIFVSFILIFGSVWIMTHLHHNLMH